MFVIVLMVQAAIDLACRDDRCYSFPADFKLELFLQRVDQDVRQWTDSDTTDLDFMRSFGDTNLDESDDDG